MKKKNQAAVTDIEDVVASGGDFGVASGGGKSSPKVLKIVLSAAGGLLLILFVIVIYVFNFSKPENAEQLTETARIQSQILQVSKIGAKHANSQEVKNLSATTYLSLVGDQPELVQALSAQNVSAPTGENPEIEQELIRARQENRLDSAINDWLIKRLEDYAVSIQASYESTEDPELREVLEVQFKNAQTLRQEE